MVDIFSHKEYPMMFQKIIYILIFLIDGDILHIYVAKCLIIYAE